MELDIQIQPSRHTNSRRMHPTTQFNTPNSHTRGISESRQCSWSIPLPRACSRSCVLVTVVRRQPLNYVRRHPHRKYIYRHSHALALVPCIATAWSYPTHICWLREQTSPVAVPRTTPPTVRLRTGHAMFLFALFIPYFDNFTPISIKLNGF